MNEPALFDTSRLIAKPCPVPYCGAIRLPAQNQVPTCQHDLDPERRRRPRACLNAIKPEHQDIPY